MNFSLHIPFQQVYSFGSIFFPIGIKVLSAIICGGLIGLEREIKNKPAGIKTNILICLGAALYTIVSILIPGDASAGGFRGDPGRVAAQIVSGIGFLGAGAIMQSRASIHGLTTAATIWIVAAIGVCIGAGYPVVAFLFTLTVLFTLLAIDRLEDKYLGRSGGHALEIIFEDFEGKTRSFINSAMEKNHIELEDFDISKHEGLTVLRVQYNKSQTSHKRFILDLWSVHGVKEVKQL